VKRLIFINGTMGAGKTATCGELLKLLGRSVFLDGDWCWMMDPFVVTDETKKMVQGNIVHLLRSFLVCSEYENVVFCWVMQYESIMDDLLSQLEDLEFEFHSFTLMVSREALAERLQKDVENHVREPGVLERSLQRLPLYEKMDTVKIDVSDISARRAAERIADAVQSRSTPEKSPFLGKDDPIGMKKRLFFDEDAVNYEKYRPGYPKELYGDVIRYSGAGAGKRALEIGIGTGKATEPFLKTGCSVTAVELGKNLADYAREKLGEYPNLSVRNLPFEEFWEADGSFDLIYSATAFHWIPEETGFQKAFRLLRSGGTLALWWNRPFPGKPGDGLFEDIQRVYEKYRPENRKKPREDRSALYRKIRETVRSYGFSEPEFRLYNAERVFDADGYLGVLNTYSDHKNVPADEKRGFEAGIREAIEKHGNRLTVYDTVDLYLARKP
jgi:SAM-dependent methyltransferase